MSVLRQPLVLGHLLLSLLVPTDMFISYTYLADTLQRLAGFSGSPIGWTPAGSGAVGLFGNRLSGRPVNRSLLDAILLLVLLMALGMLALVPALGNAWLFVATLVTQGVAQAILLIVGQVWAMRSAPWVPTLAVSLSISACNAGIDIGALADSRVIDGSGLVPFGEVSALVCLAAMTVALLLTLVPRQAAIGPSLGGHTPHWPYQGSTTMTLDRLCHGLLTGAILVFSLGGFAVEEFPVPNDFGGVYREVDGVKLYYVRGGQGPLVMLVRGPGQTRYEWRQLTPELARRLTVIAPDLPDLGQSGLPKTGYGSEQVAVYLRKLAR